MGINPIGNDIQQEQSEETQARFPTSRALAVVMKVGKPTQLGYRQLKAAT